MPNLVTLDNDGFLLVQKDLNPTQKVRAQQFKCFYQKLTGGLYPHINLYNVSSNKVKLENNKLYKVMDDQFLVECFNTTALSKNSTEVRSKIFAQAFATFPDKFTTVKEKRGQKFDTKKLKDFEFANPEMPSLDILVFDSTARTQFIRHMPRSYEYMKKLGFIFFEGYTKIADNSNVNLLPILTGRSFKPQVGGTGVEVVPDDEILDFEKLQPLWKLMSRRRCITMFNDEIGNARRGLFHYGSKQLRGFTVPPTNFYFRPFHLFATESNKFPYCTPTGEFASEKYLSLWEKFSRKYSDYCHFSFNFLTMISHDNPSHIELLDQNLRTALERLHDSGAFNATAFVIMGDHGNRISSIQRTYVGRIEERAPLFSIRLTDAFSKQYPEKIRRLKLNTKRLISNYDLHETLLSIAKGRFPTWDEYIHRHRRGVNLFEDIVSPNRSCLDAGIPPNFCLCMDKQGNSRLDRSSGEYMNVVELINEELAKYSCFQKNSIKFKDERLPTYAINQMVRHGLRDAANWPKVANTTAQLEIVFFDVTVSVTAKLATNTTRLNILFRIKHYKIPQKYTLSAEPWITNHLFTQICPHRHLKDVCAECT